MEWDGKEGMGGWKEGSRREGKEQEGMSENTISRCNDC